MSGARLKDGWAWKARHALFLTLEMMMQQDLTAVVVRYFRDAHNSGPISSNFFYTTGWLPEEAEAIGVEARNWCHDIDPFRPEGERPADIFDDPDNKYVSIDLDAVDWTVVGAVIKEISEAGVTSAYFT